MLLGRRVFVSIAFLALQALRAGGTEDGTCAAGNVAACAAEEPESEELGMMQVAKGVATIKLAAYQAKAATTAAVSPCDASGAGFGGEMSLANYREGATQGCYDRAARTNWAVVDGHFHSQTFGTNPPKLTTSMEWLREAGVLFVVLNGIGQRLPVNSSCQYYLDCPGVDVVPSMKNDFLNAESLIENAAEFAEKGPHIVASMTFADLSKPEEVLDGMAVLDKEYPGIFAWMGELNVVKQALFPNNAGHPVPEETIGKWAPFMAELRERKMPIGLHSDIGSDTEPTKYLGLMDKILSLYPDNKIVWLHLGGLSKQLTPLKPLLIEEPMYADKHAKLIAERLEKYPNLYIDLAWDVLYMTVLGDPDKRPPYIDLINKYPTRFIPGTDHVATMAKPLGLYRWEQDENSDIFKYVSDEAFQRIALGQNFIDLVGLPGFTAPPVCCSDASAANPVTGLLERPPNPTDTAVGPVEKWEAPTVLNAHASSDTSVVVTSKAAAPAAQPGAEAAAPLSAEPAVLEEMHPPSAEEAAVEEHATTHPLPEGEGFNVMPRNWKFSCLMLAGPLGFILFIAGFWMYGGLDEEDDGPTEENGIKLTTSSQTVANIVMNMLGAGMLALPGAVASSTGLMSAIFITVGFCGLMGYTFVMMGRICHVTGATSHKDCGVKVSGPVFGQYSALVCVVKTFFASLSYAIVIGDAYSAILAFVGVTVTRQTAMIAVALCVLLPLCLQRDLSILAFTSTVGIAAEFLIVCVMQVRYWDGSYIPGGKYYELIPKKPDFTDGGVNFFGVSVSTCILLGSLSTSFLAHYNAPEFYTKMRGRSPEKFQRVVIISFCFALSIYMWVMCVGYLTFGKSCAGLILNSYSQKDPVATLGRIAVAFAVTFVFPLPFNSLRTNMITALGMDPTETVPHVGVTVLFMILIFGTGCVVSDFGLVVSLGGALLGSQITLIFPGLMCYFAAQLVKGKVELGEGEARYSWILTFLGCGLVVFGSSIVLIGKFAPELIGGAPVGH